MRSIFSFKGRAGIRHGEDLELGRTHNLSGASFDNVAVTILGPA